MSNYLKLNKIVTLALTCSIILNVSCAGGKYKIDQQINDSTTYTLPKVAITKTMYACQINGNYGFKKYNFSGILFVKTMDDSSTRVVFQNEIGYNFFDFEWAHNGDFKVISIEEKMNNAALIATLRKDFEVLFHHPSRQLHVSSNKKYLWGKLPKGYVIYEQEKNNLLKNIYIVSEQYNKVVSFKTSIAVAEDTLPQNLTIEHHKANFAIKLQQLIIE